jgi:hypothetical protein
VTHLSFAITWDYRCPYARNAHEHLVVASQAGAPWDVQYLSFSLDQTHVEEGAAPVWDEPDRYPGLLANQVGIVVRDRYPERFLAAHIATFIVGDQAAFVRVLTRPAGDVALATSTIERIVDLSAGWSELNELKHTSIPR